MAIKTNLDSASVAPVMMEQKLPSFGWTYKKKFPDFPTTAIVKPLSFQTHGILISNLSGTQKMTEIIKQVVTNFPKGFDPSDLLVGDQYYIIAMARAITFGEDYKFKVVCDECGKHESIVVKVPDQLPVFLWDYKDEEEFESMMTLKLPHSKDVVVIQFPSVNKEAEVNQQNRIDRSATQSESDSPRALINRIASHIKSVNKTTPDNLKEAADYIARVGEGLDFIAIKEKIDAVSPGIRYAWDVTCDGCGVAYEAKIPLQEHFFRRE